MAPHCAESADARDGPSDEHLPGTGVNGGHGGVQEENATKGQKHTSSGSVIATLVKARTWKLEVVGPGLWV